MSKSEVRVSAQGLSVVHVMGVCSSADARWRCGWRSEYGPGYEL